LSEAKIMGLKRGIVVDIIVSPELVVVVEIEWRCWGKGLW